ncbi:MAG TPA: energy transducer TonB [Albitalea sp.]|uniref:energy transducer TonB n=1 Tax=Piscinibacter sp. TaxID=1903157 RepID=UPI002ED6BADD
MLPAADLAPDSPRAASRPPHAGTRADLTPAQRRVMVGVTVALHAGVVAALLQVREVREAVAEAAPLFVSLVTAAPTPTAPPPPVLAPPRPAPPRPPKPVIAAAPTPAPAPFVAPAATPPEPAPAPVAVAAPAAVEAPPAPPRNIPASAVQYLEPPAPVYPRASRRAGEAGRVLLRVWVDEAGLPRQVLVQQSAGFLRLDEAAVAAVQKARFKPYSENGRPTAGWALVPLTFDLEK